MSLAVTESVTPGLAKSIPNSSDAKATLFLARIPLGMLAKSSKATPSVKLRLYATTLANVSATFTFSTNVPIVNAIAASSPAAMFSLRVFIKTSTWASLVDTESKASICSM